MKSFSAILFMVLLTAPSFLQPIESAKTEDLPCLFFFYGPPGSGKDSFCAMIRHEFDLPSIHPGEALLLQALEQENPEDTDIGSPSERLLPTVLCKRLLDQDCARGALVEDLCLTTEQLTEIYNVLSPKFQCLGIEIKADADFLVSKTEQRMFCKSCGAIYTLTDGKSGICKGCDRELSIRHDDRPEVIREKVAKYLSQFGPALIFFNERKLLTEFQATNDFFKDENTVRCFILLKTHIPPNKNKHLPCALRLWSQPENP